MDSTLQTLIDIAAAEFRADASALSGASTPDDVAGWDSESQLRLTMAAEDHFGVSFDIEDFEKITSLNALAEMIAQKRAASR
jgi:acyl carrier protein